MTNEEGHGTRAIARALEISRRPVKEVLAAGTSDVPEIARAEKAELYLELMPRCKNILVCVHDELVASGAKLSTRG